MFLYIQGWQSTATQYSKDGASKVQPFSFILASSTILHKSQVEKSISKEVQYYKLWLVTIIYKICFIILNRFRLLFVKDEWNCIINDIHPIVVIRLAKSAFGDFHHSSSVAFDERGKLSCISRQVRYIFLVILVKLKLTYLLHCYYIIIVFLGLNCILLSVRQFYQSFTFWRQRSYIYQKDVLRIFFAKYNYFNLNTIIEIFSQYWER